MVEAVFYLKTLTKRMRTRLLGAVALCCLLVLGTLPMAGCSGVTVAQDIVNWTPALQGAVGTVDATASLLAPQDAPIFMAATAGFDAASNLLVAQCKTYLANPTGSVLAILQSQVISFQQNVNVALLQAARVTDPQSQQQALAAIQGVATIVAAILALVASISSPAAKAQMRAALTIKIAQVEPLLSRKRTIEAVAAHYGESFEMAQAQVSAAHYELARAGF